MPVAEHVVGKKADEQIKGMALMTIAMLVLPIMDIIGKWLATVDQLSPGVITFGRFIVQFAVLLPIVVATLGLAGLRPKNFWANMLRGLLLAIATLLFFTAVKYMPVADAIAIFFVEPLILIVLSALILREKVGWRRRLAVIAGFIGAMIVIQPSFELFGPVSLLPLGTALAFSFYLILNRKLATGDSPVVMQMLAGAGGAVFLGLILLAGDHAGVENLTISLPNFEISWLLLFTLGLISAGGHLMVVQAFRRAPASLLAPFQYFEIVTATTFGLMLFGDFPTPSKWLGIAIIILSGLYAFWREQSVKAAEN